MHVPDLGALLQEAQGRRLALEATGVYFISDIDPPHAEDLFRSLLLMALPREGQADQPITLYINSGGGSLGDGLAMMEFINRMRHDYHVRIDTAVLGYAYSMGAVVLQAGDHRTIGRFGTLMLHSTSWILSGDDERIFKDFQHLAEHYQETVAQLFAARTRHKDTAWWRRFIWSGRDRFLGPQECLDLGLVDEIVEPVLADGTALSVAAPAAAPPATAPTAPPSSGSETAADA
jgi:ATP-dependent protease ClpP protease subunit